MQNAASPSPTSPLAVLALGGASLTDGTATVVLRPVASAGDAALAAPVRRPLALEAGR